MKKLKLSGETGQLQLQLHIFRISCYRFARLISHLLQATMTTGQIACYKTGQIKNPQQRPLACIDKYGNMPYNDGKE